MSYERIHHWEGKQPVDEHNHALDHRDVRGRGKKREAARLTDPYGALEFVVGSRDDFTCFDYGILADGRVALHATINSETGHYIQLACYEIVEPEFAADEAVALVDQALEWLCMAEPFVEHDAGGWCQDPYYFARAVANALGQLGRKLVRRARKHQLP